MGSGTRKLQVNTGYAVGEVADETIVRSSCGGDLQCVPT